MTREWKSTACSGLSSSGTKQAKHWAHGVLPILSSEMWPWLWARVQGSDGSFSDMQKLIPSTSL